jgi:uncharacterized membrane protein YkvA (DUF1232 family)
MFNKIKIAVNNLKKQVNYVYLAYLDKRVKWYVKAFLSLILIYAFSPIDLIPDFIPVLGYLDDLLIIPLGITLAVKMIPHEIWEECKIKAEQGVQVDVKVKIIGALFILTLWIIIITRIITMFVK